MVIKWRKSWDSKLLFFGCCWLLNLYVWCVLRNILVWGFYGEIVLLFIYKSSFLYLCYLKMFRLINEVEECIDMFRINIWVFKIEFGKFYKV